MKSIPSARDFEALADWATAMRLRDEARQAKLAARDWKKTLRL